MSVKLPAKTEFKTFAFEVKSVDEDQGIVTGYLSTFNNIDLGNGYIKDRVRPSAFKKTLIEAKSRAQARNKKYLFPHLFMHDPEKPLGGYIDAKEDTHGLLVTVELDISRTGDVPNNPLAVMAFSGHKRGYIDEQSIGYEVIQSEIVEEVVDGEKMMVRDLTEIRLVEGSSVVSGFAMNPEAVDSSVKALTDNDSTPDLGMKTACGNTSGPIGPRDEAWDGAAAKKWIWGKALDSDGNVKAAVAKKYFMQYDGDASLKGSYGYPFWINDHISVGGVKACAGALAGARNANPGSDGASMRAKVATLYSRINAKYPDDPELTVPWAGDGKARSPMQTKTFQEHFADEQCADLLEDWQDVLLCALSCAVLDAFKIGDTPEPDIRDALSAFSTAVMTWCEQGVQYGLSDYLEQNAPDYNPADYTIQYGSDSSPNYGGMGYHARRDAFARKRGSSFSAANREKLSDHVAALKTLATSHTKALRDAADGLLEKVGGGNAQESEDDNDGDENQDGGDSGKDEGGSSGKSLKAGRAISAATMGHITDHAESIKALAAEHGKALRTKATDLTTLWAEEGQGPAYADDKTRTNDEEQGKTRKTSTIRREPSPRGALPRSDQPDDTLSTEDAVMGAVFSRLQALQK